MVSIIAAVDRNLGIGFQNKLLFWLPNDLKRFKALTTGNTIIMGRKTFDGTSIISADKLISRNPV